MDKKVKNVKKKSEKIKNIHPENVKIKISDLVETKFVRGGSKYNTNCGTKIGAVN